MLSSNLFEDSMLIKSSILIQIPVLNQDSQDFKINRIVQFL